MPGEKIETINPLEYRAFCMRGEGRCNFVISAKGANEGQRIVWRLAKHRKSGSVNIKPKCQIINTYLERFVSPFLGESYLIKAKVVQISAEHMHYLAKIPSLPHNLKIEGFEELMDESKYPRQMSFFDNKKWPGIKFVGALEMPDATRIPRQLPFVYGPTITLEIKPKQGFFQNHSGVNVPFCNNCILQIEKWKSAAFEKMYDFCPLSLYSGNREKMHAALSSLIRDPHRNLRIFVDGDVVHDELQQQICQEALCLLMFPSQNADIDTFVSVVSCILSGVADDQGNNDDKFYIHEKSVLADLLAAQRVDTVGIVQAHNHFKQLPPKSQEALRNKSNLTDHYKDLSFLEQTDDSQSLVERYLLAATMKDCSLMISVRLVDKLGVSENMLNAIGGAGVVRVKGLDGKKLYFAYSVRIVDLDPKSAKNLENAYRRFTTGVNFLRKNPKLHRPCI